MRTYERNGVHVDQCADCRGIFLDRGELERLVDAENAWHDGATPTRQPAAPRSAPPHPASGHQQQPPTAASLGSVVSEVLGQVRSSSSSAHGSHGKPRKKSLISELFG